MWGGGGGLLLELVLMSACTVHSKVLLFSRIPFLGTLPLEGFVLILDSTTKGIILRISAVSDQSSLHSLVHVERREPEQYEAMQKILFLSPSSLFSPLFLCPGEQDSQTKDCD